VLEQGICFLNFDATPAAAIEFFNFATQQVTSLFSLEKGRTPFGPPALAVSADGQQLLYWQVDQIDNDIMLVENFR
jgi:hypothetical protein